MLEKLASLEEKYEELGNMIGDPEVIADLAAGAFVKAMPIYPNGVEYREYIECQGIQERRLFLMRRRRRTA